MKLFLLFFLLSFNGKGGFLEEVKVEGNENISEEFIIKTAGFEKGKFLTQKDIKKGLEKLFATDNFADIEIEVYEGREKGNIILVLKVKENPRVQGIRFEGVKKLKEKDILEKLDIVKGMAVTGYRMKKWENEIIEIYREKGFSGTEVKIELEENKDSPHFVDVIFYIKEGKKARIKEIEVIGNEHFSDSRLEILLRNREKEWYRKAIFREEYWEEDLPKIEEFYKNNGFIEAKVDSYKIEPEGEWLYIKIFVTENKRYYVGDFTFVGHKVFEEKELKNVVKLKKGSPFAFNKFVESIQNIQGLYADSGYLLVKVFPEEKRRNDTIDIIFMIKEGGPVYVRHIDIVGNTRTREYVIRRELDIYPGDKFSRTKVIKSLRDLYFLNYFEKVDFRFNILPDSQNVDLVFEVKDKPTGTLQAGGSWSEVQKGAIMLAVTESNLFGRGQYLSLSAEFGPYRQNFRFFFTEPWLFSKHYSLGVGFHHYVDVFPAEYSVQRTGASISFSRPYDKKEYIWSISRYDIDRTIIFDFSKYYDPADPFDLRKEKWPKIVSRFTQGFYRDSRDRKFNARKGSRIEYKVTFFGGIFQGDEHFHKHVFSFTFYRGFWRERIVPVVNIKTGVMYPYNPDKNIPVYQYFRPGGIMFSEFIVRGYEERSLGYKSDGVVIGGKAAYSFNFEIHFPFSEQGYALLFFDAGNGWRDPGTMKKEFGRYFKGKAPRMKRSFGIGVRLEIPMLGVIGIDLAYPLDALEKNIVPHFIMGTRF